jgi:hypothetical protein
MFKRSDFRGAMRERTADGQFGVIPGVWFVLSKLLKPDSYIGEIVAAFDTVACLEPIALRLTVAVD